MRVLQDIKVALSSIRSNLLRTILTLMIIAFGIFALVGILTVIDVMLFKMSDSFSGMGANSFSIERKSTSFKSSGGGRTWKVSDPISYRQAVEFAERYDAPSEETVHLRAKRNAVLKYKDKKTNPNIRITGIDGSYLDIKDRTMQYGRGFSASEIEYGRNLVILGSDIATRLFGKNLETAVQKEITLDNKKFRVIGVLAKAGSALSDQVDKEAYIPLLTAKTNYGSSRTNYKLDIQLPTGTEMDEAVSDAIGVMRSVRGLRTIEENDFEIEKSDAMLGMIKENTMSLRFAAIFIGGITLMGAAIGLMNIMLVSVTERTREIGVRKALGATKSNIRRQFITEAIVICQIGGVLGVILSILIGIIITAALGGTFVMPWGWIILGFTVCTIVGLASGVYPAVKASNLDPIESLRFE